MTSSFGQNSGFIDFSLKIFQSPTSGVFCYSPQKDIISFGGHGLVMVVGFRLFELISAKPMLQCGTVVPSSRQHTKAIRITAGGLLSSFILICSPLYYFSPLYNLGKRPPSFNRLIKALLSRARGLIRPLFSIISRCSG
jgi:hypothetical protein